MGTAVNRQHILLPGENKPLIHKINVALPANNIQQFVSCKDATDMKRVRKKCKALVRREFRITWGHKQELSVLETIPMDKLSKRSYDIILLVC